MNEHPIASIVCIMSGVFGAIFIVALLAPFDAKNITARQMDEKPSEEKSNLQEYKSVWNETKGVRFLFPLGLALCLLSYIVHRVWLK